jgi:hypothetical protein
VWGFVAAVQNLVCKLMGHFMDKNLNNSVPRVVEDKISAQANFASFTGPIPKFLCHVPETE